MSYVPTKREAKQSYVEQYVPAPIATFGAVLEAKQGQQDNAAALIAQNKDAFMGQSGVGERDNEYLKGKKEYYEEFASRFDNRDLTDPQAMREFRDEAKRLAGDQTLAKIAENHQKYQKFIARQEELKKKGGHAYDPDLEFRFIQSLNNYGKIGAEGNATLEDPLITEGVDIPKELDSYVAGIQSEGSDVLRELDGIVYTNSWSGVSRGKMSKVIQDQLETYIQSPAARQLMERHYAQTGGKATPKQMEEYAIKQLHARAEKHIGIHTKDGSAAARTEKKKKDKENATQPWLLTGGLPPGSEGGDAQQFDADGKPKGSGQGIVAAWEKNVGLPIIERLTKTAIDSYNDTSLSPEEEAVLKPAINHSKIYGTPLKDSYAHINRVQYPQVEVYKDKKKRDDETSRYFDPKLGVALLQSSKLIDLQNPTKRTNFEEYLRVNAEGETQADRTKILADNGFTITGPRTVNQYGIVRPAVLNGKDVLIDESQHPDVTQAERDRHARTMMATQGLFMETDDNGSVIVHYPDPKDPKKTISKFESDL